MATTQNLQTLKINYLSQSQYNTALANGQINSDELYLTPGDSYRIQVGSTAPPSTADDGVIYMQYGATPRADYVTEYGSSSSWFYRKWNSGKVEAWTTYTPASQTPSVWVSPIYYKDITVSIPSGLFSSAPTNVQAMNIETNRQWTVYAINISSATSMTVRVIKPNADATAPSLSIYLSNM